MIRIALCDDTDEYRQQTRQLLEQWGSHHNHNLLIDCFDNGDALLNSLNKQPYDLIFLDIIMPMLSGIDTCAEIRRENKQVRIIFLSVSPEFGVDAFRVRANHYLLKPVQKEQLFGLLDEYLAETDSDQQFLVARTPNMIRKVPFSSIRYLEAQDKQILIFTDGSEILSVTIPLHQLAQELRDPRFFQCHRSYIVNMNYIHSYTKNTVTMENGQTLPVSRSCAKEFHDAYFAFLFGKAGDR